MLVIYVYMWTCSTSVRDVTQVHVHMYMYVYVYICYVGYVGYIDDTYIYIRYIRRTLTNPGTPASTQLQQSHRNS